MYKARCADLNACGDLRASCPQDVSTKAGCQALDACSGRLAVAAGSSPFDAERLGLIGKRCPYSWKDGHRVNGNWPMNEVGYERPGFMRTSSPAYRDPGVSSEGRARFVADGVQDRIDKALTFYSDCAADPVSVRRSCFPEPAVERRAPQVRTSVRNAQGKAPGVTPGAF